MRTGQTVIPTYKSNGSFFKWFYFKQDCDAKEKQLVVNGTGTADVHPKKRSATKRKDHTQQTKDNIKTHGHSGGKIKTEEQQITNTTLIDGMKSNGHSHETKNKSNGHSGSLMEQDSLIDYANNQQNVTMTHGHKGKQKSHHSTGAKSVVHICDVCCNGPNCNTLGACV